MKAQIYDTGMEGSRFYRTFMQECDFRYTDLAKSTFAHGSFADCVITDCDIEGMTIDGVSVAEALAYYRDSAK